MYHEGATIISRNYLPQRNNVPIVEKRLIAGNVRPRNIICTTYDLNCNREIITIEISLLLKNNDNKMIKIKK